MPSFISKRGMMYPAYEEIGLQNKSDKSIKYGKETIPPGGFFVYKGPCREAVKILMEEGNTDKDGNKYLGRDFIHDPDFLQAIRNMGYSNGKEGVQEYLDMIGYNEEEEDKKFKEKARTIKAHEIPKRVNAIKELAGGKDYSGGGSDTYGGFGKPDALP